MLSGYLYFLFWRYRKPYQIWETKISMMYYSLIEGLARTVIYGAYLNRRALNMRVLLIYRQKIFNLVDNVPMMAP